MNRRISRLRSFLIVVGLPTLMFLAIGGQSLPGQSPGYPPPAAAPYIPPRAQPWAASQGAANTAPSLPAQSNPAPAQSNPPPAQSNPPPALNPGQSSSPPQYPPAINPPAPAQPNLPQYSQPQYQAPQYSQPQYQSPQYSQPQYQAPQYPAAQYLPTQHVPQQPATPPATQPTNVALRQGAGSSQSFTPPDTTSRQQVPPVPGAAAPTLIGIWQGQSTEDGICTVMFEANGRASYSFSAGRRERSAGVFRATGRDELVYTPDSTHVPETWSVSLDAKGRLLIEMEEDRDDDEEEITLTRIK